MAVLSDEDRVVIWREFMQEISSLAEPISISKTELRAAFDAADNWVNTNSAAFNSALPQPARGSLTAPQKARLLMFVVRRRFLSGA
jgi:hypothetical protein